MLWAEVQRHGSYVQFNVKNIHGLTVRSLHHQLTNDSLQNKDLTNSSSTKQGSKAIGKEMVIENTNIYSRKHFSQPCQEKHTSPSDERENI